MEMTEAQEGKSQHPKHISSFYSYMSANSPLAKASHMAKVKVKRQGSVPDHHESTARVWMCHIIRGESRTGADHLIPK